MMPRPSPGLRGIAGNTTAGLLLLLALSGCGGARPLSSTTPAARAGDTAPEVERRLRAAEQSWHGTPYRYGGTTREGIDCSGFVSVVYQQLFGLSLPRVTAEQVQEGVPVPPGGFQAGDLVFFRPRGKVRHVGIYLGRGEFAHAATSEGVTVSRLDDPYWREAYWTARRLLPDVPADLPGTPSSAAAGAARPAVRSGW